MLKRTRTVRRSHRTLLGDFNIGGLKVLSDAEDTFLNPAIGGTARTEFSPSAVIQRNKMTYRYNRRMALLL